MDDQNQNNNNNNNQQQHSKQHIGSQEIEEATSEQPDEIVLDDVIKTRILSI
jgi:hypothetical protein